MKIRLFVAMMAVLLCFLFSGCGPTLVEQKQARIHLDIGVAYLKSQRYAPALRELMTAEKLTPENPEVHYFKGSSYYGSGLKDDAIREFKRAVTLKPDYSEAHNYLGVIYMERGLYKDALDSFARALSNILYETPALPLNSMGDIYYKKGEYETALEKYEEAIEREPRTYLLPLIEKNMGRTLLAMKETERAISHLERAVKTSPFFAEARYWLGISYLREGNKKKAVEELREAVKADPQAPFGQKAKERLLSIIGSKQ